MESFADLKKADILPLLRSYAEPGMRASRASYIAVLIKRPPWKTPVMFRTNLTDLQ